MFSPEREEARVCVKPKRGKDGRHMNVFDCGMGKLVTSASSAISALKPSPQIFNAEDAEIAEKNIYEKAVIQFSITSFVC